MASETIIAWTDHTFNAWWGCVKVSEGCRNCYAAGLAQRYGHDVFGPGKGRRLFGAAHWQEPFTWVKQASADRRRHRVFCGSMMDWAEAHPDVKGARALLWDTIRATPELDWQLLTKRPGNIAAMLPEDWGDGWPHVWLGTSVEDMTQAHRVATLSGIPAAVRFMSYEPALGPLDDLDLTGLHWVIYGGESGAKYREHDLAWPRAMREKCERAGVAFFFKQSAARFTERGTTLDGETIRLYPRTPFDA